MSRSGAPARAEDLDEEMVFAVADAPASSLWWLPVAVVATVVPISAFLLWFAGVADTYLPAGGRLVIPLYYDGLYVAARTGHVPPAYYYAVFVPGLGTLVAAVYLVHRYRVMGARRGNESQRSRQT